MKGDYKLPNIRSSNHKHKRNCDIKHNISTVPEDEEECKSSDSIEITSSSIACDSPIKPGNFTLTRGNLNKLELKNERATVQSSLIGDLMKDMSNGRASQSYMHGSSTQKLTCGKMFMLSDRYSFIGTASLLGTNISTIISGISSAFEDNVRLSDCNGGNHRMSTGTYQSPAKKPANFKG